MNEWVIGDGVGFSSNRWLARRLTDEQMFEPSYPEWWTDEDSYRAVLEGPSYYFREIEKLPRRWYRPFRLWRRTGRIWEPDDHTLFEAVSV